jgi:hypothetical protein
MSTLQIEDEDIERKRRVVSFRGGFGAVFSNTGPQVVVNVTNGTVGSMDQYHSFDASGSVTIGMQAATGAVLPESDYDLQLAEQIARLTKMPPAKVFDTPEELMDWLDDPRK